MRPVSVILSAAFVLGTVACGDDTEETASAEGAAKKVVSSATFDCKTIGDFFGKEPHTFKFSLSGLEGNDHLAWEAESKLAAESEDMLPPIVTTPEFSSLASLNENSSVTFEKDNLRLWGDSDGLESVTVILYRNSNFRAGWVRVEGEGGDAYSKVSCKLTELPKAEK